MPTLKIAVLGAGSFVFGPSVLKGILIEQRLDDIALALVDPDREAVELMAGVAERLARESGLRVRVVACTERGPGLDGADFVLSAVAQQIGRRHGMDQEQLARHAPNEVPTEFGGVCGISYSLRQIALLTAIGADVRRFCPKAWLLNMANPLPRVCQALHEEGLRVAGFCSVALGGYGMLWQFLRGERLDYPWTRAREAWAMKMGGLNHFSWLLGLQDRRTGEDLLPEVRRQLAEGRSLGQPLTDLMFRQTGCVPLPGDSHIRDFLAPTPVTPRGHEFWHGGVEERRERLERLRAVGEGRAPWQELTVHESWEKPVDLVAALALDRTVEIPALNLVNQGQIAELPEGVFVETPCRADRNGPVPQRVELPEEVLPLCRQTAEVTRAVVRAARARSRALLRKAVQLDPVIVDKKAGWTALQACLEAHADVLPTYR
jgi:alpha-galactosidase